MSYLGLETPCEEVSPNFHAFNGWDCTDWPQVNRDFGLGTPCKLVLKSLNGGKCQDRPTSLHTRVEVLTEQRNILEGVLYMVCNGQCCFMVYSILWSPPRRLSCLRSVLTQHTILSYTCLELYDLCTQAGVKVEEAAKEGLYGLEVWPAIVWHPEWALTIAGVRQKMLNGNNLKASSITQKSALVIKGQQITFNGLHLDGTLLVRAVRGAQARITDPQMPMHINHPIFSVALTFQCELCWLEWSFATCHVTPSLVQWPPDACKMMHCVSHTNFDVEGGFLPRARSHLHLAGPHPSHALFIARSSCMHLRWGSSLLGINVRIPGQNYKHSSWHRFHYSWVDWWSSFACQRSFMA